ISIYLGDTIKLYLHRYFKIKIKTKIMNRKNLLLAIFSLVGLTSAQAQINILNAKTPQEIGVKSEEQKLLENDNPLPYGYINEDRDVLQGTMVWEIID